MASKNYSNGTGIRNRYFFHKPKHFLDKCMVPVYRIGLFHKYILVKTIDKIPDEQDKGHTIFYQKVFACLPNTV